MADDGLLAAAMRADAPAVRECLASGADVNTTDARGMTALMIAAWRGLEDVAREVLAHGPDFSPRATDGWRALTYAAANTFPRPDGSRTDVLRLLIEGGDRPAPGDADWKALHYAADWGHAENLVLLLDHGMDPNLLGPEDALTPLMRAARKSKAPCVRVLLDHGADPNAVDEQGMSALMYAASRANADQVRALLGAGAQTDLKNSAGETALAIAQRSKKKAIVALLSG